MGDSGTVAFEVERAGEISRHEVDIDEWQSDRRQVDPFASLGMSRATPPAFREEPVWATLRGRRQ